jgi:hypothetical protein
MLHSSSPVEEKEDKVDVEVNGLNLCDSRFVRFRIRRNYTLTKCHRDIKVYCLLKKCSQRNITEKYTLLD